MCLTVRTEKAQKQAKTPQVTPGGVPGESLTRRGFEGNRPRGLTTFDTKTAPTGASMTPGGEIPQPLETTRIAGRCDRREVAKRPPAFILHFFRPPKLRVFGACQLRPQPPHNCFMLEVGYRLYPTPLSPHREHRFATSRAYAVCSVSAGWNSTPRFTACSFAWWIAAVRSSFAICRSWKCSSASRMGRMV